MLTEWTYRQSQHYVIFAVFLLALPLVPFCNFYRFPIMPCRNLTVFRVAISRISHFVSFLPDPPLPFTAFTIFTIPRNAIFHSYRLPCTASPSLPFLPALQFPHHRSAILSFPHNAILPSYRIPRGGGASLTISPLTVGFAVSPVLAFYHPPKCHVSSSPPGASPYLESYHFIDLIIFSDVAILLLTFYHFAVFHNFEAPSLRIPGRHQPILFYRFAIIYRFYRFYQLFRPVKYIGRLKEYLRKSYNPRNPSAPPFPHIVSFQPHSATEI